MHSLAAANIIARQVRWHFFAALVALAAGVVFKALFPIIFAAAAGGGAVALAIVRRRFLPPEPRA